LALPNANLPYSSQFDPQGFFQSASQNEQTQRFYNHQAQTSTGISQLYNPIGNFAPPVFYYMSPPITPLSSNLYMPLPPSCLAQQQPSQFNSCVLIIKNAPIRITVNEIVQFLSAYGEVRYF